MHTRRSPRRGVALAVSLLAIVIVSVLIAGAFFAAMQELRTGRGMLARHRAFLAAEYGLNATVAAFDPALNLTMAPGDVRRLSYNDSSAAGIPPSGARSDVAFMRLTRSLYWIVSEGLVNPGSANESVRRVNSVYRVRRPAIPIGGAITSMGSVTVLGGVEVTGTNSPPAGWTQCDSIGGLDTAAIAVGDSATVTIRFDSTVTGTADYYRDGRYDDTSTFGRFGEVTMDELASSADIVLSDTPDPMPSGTDSTCDRSGAAARTNWGEPWRGRGTDGCNDYFPIIYSPGDLVLSRGRGQGILLVNGSVRFEGDFEFYGTIIVRNDVTQGTGTGKISGAIVAGGDVRAENSSVSGNARISWSACASERAATGSSRIAPVSGRAWADMF